MGCEKKRNPTFFLGFQKPLFGGGGGGGKWNRSRDFSPIYKTTTTTTTCVCATSSSFLLRLCLLSTFPSNSSSSFSSAAFGSKLSKTSSSPSLRFQEFAATLFSFSRMDSGGVERERRRGFRKRRKGASIQSRLNFTWLPRFSVSTTEFSGGHRCGIQQFAPCGSDSRFKWHIIR